MNKKGGIALSLIIVGVVLVIGIGIGVFYFSGGEKELDSNNYSLALKNVENCNEDMMAGNKSDWCAEYHDHYRECTYGSGKLYCSKGNALVNGFGLSKEDARSLCTNYLHKGLGANCLRELATNQEDINDCINFAAGDDYLIAICNLDEGEKISETFEPRNIDAYM